jgi:septal ring factor EnvC (AmiA/AmiB activator)
VCSRSALIWRQIQSLEESLAAIEGERKELREKELRLVDEREKKANEAAAIAAKLEDVRAAIAQRADHSRLEAIIAAAPAVIPSSEVRPWQSV